MNSPKSFETLGRFVHAFAKVEQIIHGSFQVISKIPRDAAMAVKGPARVSDVIKMEKQLLRINKYPPETISDLENCFTQFTHISEMRDRAIHRGPDESDGGNLFVSNVATMRSLAHLETVSFNIRDIKNATADLKRIWYRVFIGANLLLKNFSSKTPAKERALFAPWLYKPLILKNPVQQSHKAIRIAKPQRKSSVE